jgi:sugar lactone lactonase YvrE
MCKGVTLPGEFNRVDRMTSRRRLAVALLGLAAVLVAQPGAVSAAPVPPATPHEYSATDGAYAGAYVAKKRIFPDTIALPTGFQPEGIAIGRLPYAYLGSLADGSIYRINLATGAGEFISEGPGTHAVGITLDSRGRLFVAGGAAGDARVVDTRTGDVLASYPLGTGAAFVNDVVVTPSAAWFTDSQNAVLYGLPLGPRGELPAADDVVRLPLGGDWQQQEGFNANGIARTPDGRALLVVQSVTGFLFRVDPATGVATRVDLGGELVINGDGLLVLGRTLHVVQNSLNQVAVFRLNPAGTAGTLTHRLTDPRFDVPTTVAAWGDRLYLPNARFGIPEPDTADFTVVAIRRPS